MRRIDHTAVAVHNLAEAVPRYESLLGGHAGERIVMADQGVEVTFVSMGDTELELVQPLDPTSGVARFLDSRGEGLHHVGVAVDDLVAELRRLEADGVRLIDRVPRRGVHGLIAFIHPHGTGGVLVELVQHEA